MRLPHPITTSVAAGLLTGLAFWLACGPGLEYRVVAGQGWHVERFTPFGTMLIAAMLGGVVAVVVAAALWIARRARRHPGTS